MKIIIADNYEKMCAEAADIVQKVIENKADARLGLATGSSPLGLYDELARRCADGQIDFSRVSTVNLDEYVGLEPSDPQSYRFFMDKNLFERINIDRKNTYVAKGVGDMERNIAEFRDVIAARRIDLQLLGIGVDGHIGFNEPGDALYDSAHTVELTPSTIDANARFFKRKDDVPHMAVTMGVGDIMRADRLLLLIAGESKRQAAEQLLLSERITTENPATLIRLHRDATVIIEKKLADAVGI